MTVSLLAAVARHRVIGRDNTLPWRLPDDLRRFRKLTLHKTVIMGRRTFESLPAPLRDRHCVVVTHQTAALRTASDIEVVASLDQALDRARSEEIFIIGGASLYEQTIAQADRLYITEVEATVAGDAFFPVYDKAQWETIACEIHPADDRHAYAFRYLTLDRKA